MSWTLCPADRAGARPPSALGPGARAGGKGGLLGNHLCSSPASFPFGVLESATRELKSQHIVLSLSLLICKMETACPPLKVLLRLGVNAGKTPGPE